MALSSTEVREVRWADLLQRAVSEPGILSTAYSQFHNYSLGNVLLAAFRRPVANGA